MQKSFVTLAGIVLAAQMLSAGSVYDYRLNSIDYENVPLSDFKGKVLMIVNVASRCGYTPQYAGLESLYRRYKNQGFVIVGIPPMISASKNRGQTRKSSNSASASTTSRFL
jgi:glutathione peroxidase